MKRLRWRGVAAIETALVMFALSVLLVHALRYGLQAEGGAALDRAASNAARYLATVPIQTLRSSARRAAVLATARGLIDETLAAANLDVSTLEVQFLCDPGLCDALTPSTVPATVPSKVGVLASMQYRNDMFSSIEPVGLSVYAEVGRGN